MNFSRSVKVMARLGRCLDLHSVIYLPSKLELIIGLPPCSLGHYSLSHHQSMHIHTYVCMYVQLTRHMYYSMLCNSVQ